MPDFDRFLGTLQNNNQMKSSQESAVRCANCGAPNSPTAIVCANCGNAVSKQLSGSGFTVNKNVFGRESQSQQTPMGQNSYTAPQQFYTRPEQARMPLPPQPTRHGARAGHYYREPYRSDADYYSYYNNGNGRSMPVVPQRPVGSAYGQPAERARPYYSNGNGMAAPLRNGTVQPYPVTSYSNSTPRSVASHPQQSYGQSAYAAPQRQYEVIIPESAPQSASQWPESYNGAGYGGSVPQSPAFSLPAQPPAAPPQQSIAPPQPPVAEPSAPVQAASWPTIPPPETAEQSPLETSSPGPENAVALTADKPVTPQREEVREIAVSVEPETDRELKNEEETPDNTALEMENLSSFSEPQETVPELEHGEEKAESPANRPAKPFDEPKWYEEEVPEQEEYEDEEWDEEQPVETDLAEPEEEEEEYESQPDTGDPSEDAYAKRLRIYREQLRLAFDDPKPQKKETEKKRRRSYRDDAGSPIKSAKAAVSEEKAGSSPRDVQEEQPAENIKPGKDSEPVLVWKNIPPRGKTNSKRPIAPERPNLYKQGDGKDRRPQPAVDQERDTGRLTFSKIKTPPVDKPGRTESPVSGVERKKSTVEQNIREKVQATQPVDKPKDYYAKPEKMDEDYEVTILTAEEKPGTRQADPEPRAEQEKEPPNESKRHVRTERSVPEQSPFSMESGTAQNSFGAPVPQMWTAYQQQMVSGYGATVNGQPVMVSPQMQTYAQIQGFPGMGGQPVTYQSGMMPTGIPVPMYVMINPGGGMTMYYMNPATVPPMLPPDRTPGDRPFESLTGSQAVVSETLEKIRSHERYDGRYLAYMDLSGDKYLRWEHIRFADNIVGVKYPSDFDIENADFTGKDISFSDFSTLPFLKWKQIKRATSLKGIIYPKEFNIDRADYSGRDISQSDFSHLRLLSWKHISAAGKIKGIVYPEDFDIERADFSGRDISFSDFTRVEALRWKHIRGAGSIRGIEYPAEFNIDRTEFFDRDVSFSDFTRVTGFRWHHIVNTYRIYGIAYPDTFDVDNADFSGRNISYSDFSKVHRLTFIHIRTAQKINGIIYPPTYNMQRTDYRGRDISYSDFSLVKNMRFEHIAGAAQIKGMVYPPSFDLENADFRGFDMSDSDFSLLPIYKKAYLEPVSGENITFPSTGSTIR